MPGSYPRLAAFVNTDPSFMIFRRFGYVRARLILDQQEKLREMEAELDDLDEADNHYPRAPLRSRSADVGSSDQRRRILLVQLAEELKAYGMQEAPIQRWLTKHQTT